MNKFGGSWTEQKIQIVTDYARAYLKIMAPRKYWKLLYFDGFAGTGDICTRDTDQDSLIAGAARRILEIYSPCIPSPTAASSGSAMRRPGARPAASSSSIPATRIGQAGRSTRGTRGW